MFKDLVIYIDNLKSYQRYSLRLSSQLGNNQIFTIQDEDHYVQLLGNDIFLLRQEGIERCLEFYPLCDRLSQGNYYDVIQKYV